MSRPIPDASLLQEHHWRVIRAMCEKGIRQLIEDMNQDPDSWYGDKNKE